MKILPVINCPDFRTAREHLEIAKSFLGDGDFVHLDVADGAFTFHKTWANATEWANLRSHVPLEVHLMVEHPEKHIESWLAAGAKRFVVHVETVSEETFAAIVARCHKRGVQVMLSSNPQTQARKLEPFFKHTSWFQVLSVYPGPAGQRFLPLTMRKVQWIRKHMPGATIEVDGGITPTTARQAKKAGADMVTSESYILKSKNPAEAYDELVTLPPVRSTWYRETLEKRARMSGSRITEALTEKRLEEMAFMANRLREDVIEMVSRAGSGHIAGPLDMAEVITALYFHLLKHDPKRPGWPGRDRVVLSNGHVCPVQYAALARAGYFPVDELRTLRKIGTRLQGHPHRGSLPGIETTSGPLGSGLSQACGMALAARLDHASWRTYCLMSDGEHEEGNTWEAVMFAGKNKLNNLTAIVDRNNIQIDGFTENIMPLEPLRAKYEAFGWHVLEIDGHNFEEIVAAVNEARAVYEKPTCVIAHTIPGKGVDFMEHDYLWHSKPFKPGEARKALVELRTLRGKIRNEYE